MIKRMIPLLWLVCLALTLGAFTPVIDGTKDAEWGDTPTEATFTTMQPTEFNLEGGCYVTDDANYVYFGIPTDNDPWGEGASIHFHLSIDLRNTAAGGTGDAWGSQVQYGQTYLPEHDIIMQWSTDDPNVGYTGFMTWNGSGWDQVQLDSGNIAGGGDQFTEIAIPRSMLNSIDLGEELNLSLWHRPAWDKSNASSCIPADEGFPSDWGDDGGGTQTTQFNYVISTALADTTPPRMSSVVQTGPDMVRVTFNEPMSLSAIAVSNYTIDNGASIVDVTSVSSSVYDLEVSGLTPGTLYEVAATSAIEDVAGNPIDPAYDSGTFTASAYADVTFTVNDNSHLYEDINIKGSFDGWGLHQAYDDGTNGDPTAGDFSWTCVVEDVPEDSWEWGAIEDDGSEYGIWLIDGPNLQFTVDNAGAVTGDTSYDIAGGISRDVLVSFAVNIGSLDASAISIQGSVPPLNWSTGNNLLQDIDGDNIYTVGITFPAGSNFDVEYKFAYDDGNRAWVWENVDNRTFTIDDSGNSMDLDIDYWNGMEVTELTAVAFMDSSASEYTNFQDGDVLGAGSNILIEVEADAVDANNNSGFNLELHYRINEGLEVTRDFTWHSNDESTSYWRTMLDYGEDIDDGDEVQFRITGIDYNGPEVEDNNGGNDYFVSLGTSGTQQDVEVTFTFNLGGSDALEVGLVGTLAPLSGLPEDNLMYDENEDKIYTTTVTFPAGSPYAVSYNYARYFGEVRSWQIEPNITRSFNLDDVTGVMDIGVEYWEGVAVSELTGVTFMDSENSAYTNFLNDGTVDADGNIQIEARVDGVDANANSNFNVVLWYQVNGGEMESKALGWASNDGDYSWWQVMLENGVDVNNGDDVSFYVSAIDYNGPEYADDNDGASYNVRVLSAGTSQDVLVTFSINVGALNADSISVQGSEFPLDWTAGSTPMNDDDGDKTYTADVLFPAGSPYTVQYKFTRSTVSTREWAWEYVGNRSFQINDTESTQVLDLDYWNLHQVHEMTSVAFADSTVSEYTNFAEGDVLALGSDVLIEAFNGGIDTNYNSGFELTLHYTVNGGAEQTAVFNWQGNDNDYSWWRIGLVNGEDVADNDQVEFWITATDYNGPLFTDDNGGNNYSVSIGQAAPPAAPQDVTISIVGTDVQLSWTAVAGATGYRLQSCSTPDGTFNNVLVTPNTSVTINGGAGVADKKFYIVKAIN